MKETRNSLAVDTKVQLCTGLQGTIIDKRGEKAWLYVTVQWENGCTACYSAKSLTVIAEVLR